MILERFEEKSKKQLGKILIWNTIYVFLKKINKKFIKKIIKFFI
jgi:hypothetical protein